MTAMAPPRARDAAEANDDDPGQLLDDAARVHAMTREVNAAISGLAVHPLDEHVAAEMIEVLGSGGVVQARAALRRLRLVNSTDDLNADATDLDGPEGLTGS